MRPNHIRLTWLALAALLLATRIDHFGSSVRLPDAAYAVFFLAGSFGLSGRAALGLALLAGTSDILSISRAGDAFCFTAAYPLLFVAYAVLWWFGATAQGVRPVRMLVLGALASTVAFGIANAGFYLFSGRFGSLSFAAYVDRVAGYLSHYVSATLLYVAPVAAFSALRRARASRMSEGDAADASFD